MTSLTLALLPHCKPFCSWHTRLSSTLDTWQMCGTASDCSYCAALRVATRGSLVAPNLVRSLFLHGLHQSSYVWIFAHRALTPCLSRRSGLAVLSCLLAEEGCGHSGLTPLHGTVS